MTDSAMALSNESPTVPIDARFEVWMPRQCERGVDGSQQRILSGTVGSEKDVDLGDLEFLGAYRAELLDADQINLQRGDLSKCGAPLSKRSNSGKLYCKAAEWWLYKSAARSALYKVAKPIAKGKREACHARSAPGTATHGPSLTS
jgi:hypothetical protein